MVMTDPFTQQSMDALMGTWSKGQLFSEEVYRNLRYSKWM